MCASYGLDPRFAAADLIDAADADLLDGLREWARENDDATLRPTGRIKRNLNPLVVEYNGAPAVESAWWGYLVDGVPAKFPSINTRSERLRDQTGNLRTRAIVPATRWFEMQKPSKIWHEFVRDDDALFGMAAVTRRGQAEDGTWFTCYSIVMRPAPDHLADVHDRMPVLLPADFSRDWLTAPPTRELMDDALLASDDAAARIRVRPGRP